MLSDRFRRLFDERPQLPFILPLVVFGLFLALENQFPQAKSWLYPTKTVATGLCLWFLRRQFKSLSWRWSYLGIVIGIVVFVQWVGMEEFFRNHWQYPPLPIFGGEGTWQAEIFNPQEFFGGRNLSFWLWVVVRMAGAVIVVPVMEELFWRGFLLRFFESRFRYFERIPLGEFGWFSCFAVAGLFALVHSWYISAFVCCLFYNWLMYKTRSMLACVTAHALTNLLLWIYILYAGAWWLS